MSPTLNNSSKSNLVQLIDENSIMPLFPSIVSISVEKRFIFLIIDKFHPIDFSNLKSSRFFDQSELFFLFNKGPLHPFFLSNSIKPFLSEIVACSCNLRFNGY